MIENCGMPEEKIYMTAEEIPGDSRVLFPDYREREIKEMKDMVHFVGAGSGAAGFDNTERKKISGRSRCDRSMQVLW